MNRYHVVRPRMACGVAAVAMTVLTIRLMVVLPSQIEDQRADHAGLPAAPAAALRGVDPQHDASRDSG